VAIIPLGLTRRDLPSLMIPELEATAGVKSVSDDPQIVAGRDLRK
jgi:hypothetical protein